MPLKFFFDWRRTFVTAVLFPLFCGLGFWQLERASEKRHLKYFYENRKNEPPVALPWVLLSDENQNLSHLPVKISGEFLSEYQVLLTNRIRIGRGGADVIEPMLLSDGSGAALVNRGWIQVGAVGDGKIAPKSGELELTGKVHVPLGKPLGISQTKLDGSWPLKLRTINAKALAQKLSDRLGVPVFPYLIRIDAGEPGALEINWPAITIRTTGHIGYALQWFALALLTLILYVYLGSNIWRENKNRQR